MGLLQREKLKKTVNYIIIPMMNPLEYQKYLDSTTTSVDSLENYFGAGKSRNEFVFHKKLIYHTVNPAVGSYDQGWAFRPGYRGYRDSRDRAESHRARFSGPARFQGIFFEVFVKIFSVS